MERQAASGVKETGRVEAFSDGVFAIAITLLILDVKVPELSDGAGTRDLLRALGRGWTSYVAYLLSFVTILIMWVSHHRIFTVIRKIDHAFLFWNGILLMLISFVPFPTALLSRYLLEPSARTAAVVYSGHGILISLAFSGLWRYATKTDRLLAPGTRPEVTRLSARYRFGPFMYLTAFVLAFASAWLSVGLCLIFTLFFAFQGLTHKG
jgi:uncharacterized membrane protein